MIAVRLPKETEDRLNKLAEETHQSKSYYIRKAIEEFLEDEADYLLALERLKNKNPRIPLEELEKQLEMEG